MGSRITRASTALRHARQLLEHEKWIKGELKIVDEDDTSCSSVGRCALGALADVTGDLRLYGEGDREFIDLAMKTSNLFDTARQVLDEVARDLGGHHEDEFGGYDVFPNVVELNDDPSTQHNFVIKAFIEAEKRAKSAERKAAAK